VYLEICITKPSAASMQSKLVPPKLTNGKVIPVKGKIPSIAPTFIILCENTHPKVPATISFAKRGMVSSMILRILHSIAPKTPITATVPKKPNFSARIAKIESLAASGK